MEKLILKNIRQKKGCSTTYKCKKFKYKGNKYKNISIDDNSDYSDIYIDDKKDTYIGYIDKNIFDIVDSKINIVILNNN